MGGTKDCWMVWGAGELRDGCSKSYGGIAGAAWSLWVGLQKLGEWGLCGAYWVGFGVDGCWMAGQNCQWEDAGGLWDGLSVGPFARRGAGSPP